MTVCRHLLDMSELEFMVLKRNMGQYGETPASLQQHLTCL